MHVHGKKRITPDNIRSQWQGMIAQKVEFEWHWINYAWILHLYFHSFIPESIQKAVPHQQSVHSAYNQSWLHSCGVWQRFGAHETHKCKMISVAPPFSWTKKYKRDNGRFEILKQQQKEYIVESTSWNHIWIIFISQTEGGKYDRFTFSRPYDENEQW